MAAITWTVYEFTDDLSNFDIGKVFHPYVTYRLVTTLPASNISPHTYNFKNDIARSPTVPQFSGTVSPAGLYTVKLRKRGFEGALETATCDGSGVFSFRGWYPPDADYEFLIEGNATHKAGVFPVSAPIENRYNGDPVRYDSSIVV